MELPAPNLAAIFVLEGTGVPGGFPISSRPSTAAICRARVPLPDHWAITCSAGAVSLRDGAGVLISSSPC
jgi:hypothetical protein